ncbi:MAG: hypothetical protein V1707_01405 [bacterium]
MGKDLPVIVIAHPDVIIRQAYERSARELFGERYDIKGVDTIMKLKRLYKQGKIMGALLSPDLVDAIVLLRNIPVVLLADELGQEQVRNWQERGAIVCSTKHQNPSEVCQCLANALPADELA